MKLITVATDAKGYFPFLIQSCERHNADLIILGKNEKWQGFNWRNHLVLDFLSSISNPEKEVVCFIDAYDVLLLKDFSTLEDTFKNHPNSKSTVIVSYEQIKSLRAKIGSLYFGKCQGYNINAGCYIGYASNIKRILSKIWESSKHDPKADDQVLLANYCRLNPSDITIDTRQEFFSTIVKPFRNIQPSEIPTNPTPFFLHANFFTRLDIILLDQNYQYTQQDKANITRYIWTNAIKKWWYIYILEAILYIILLTIILFTISNVQFIRKRF